MQDAMTLTRSMSQLTSVYTTVDPPFFARTSTLSEEWRVRIVEALEKADGDAYEALKILGTSMTEEQLDKYTKQAFDTQDFKTFVDENQVDLSVQVRENDDLNAEPSSSSLKESSKVSVQSGGSAVGEENSQMIEGEENNALQEASQHSTKTIRSVDPDLFIEFFSHAFAHSIQYGEDLRLAAARGEDEAVEKLIRRGCNPNAWDGLGWSALHHAAQYGNVSTIEVICNTHGIEKVNIDHKDNKGWSPFMNAIANSEKECAQKLLDFGASSSLASYYGRNSLHIAAMKGLEDMCRYLLGLDDSLMEGKDKAGWTPLFCCVQHDETKIIQLLVASGCNTEALDNLGKSATTYGDDVAEAYINQTKPASPRSPRSPRN
eukprot:g1920.t1